MSSNLESKPKDAPEAIRPIIDVRYRQVGLLQARVYTTDTGAILDEMSGRVAAAPQFFCRAGVCVDLGSLEKPPSATELRAVIEAIRRVGMLPVGLAGEAEGMEALARTMDLPILSGFRGSSQAAHPQIAQAPAAMEPPAAERARAAMPARTELAPAAPDAGTAPAETGTPALMHHQPVRSGQRIYARNRDLIVTSGVAAGAEVMADGCLHVYGTLRGRAMAGVHGDLTARVFCQEFRAELVSIAGVFRIFETIPAELAGKPVQVWLAGENLHCAPIGS